MRFKMVMHVSFSILNNIVSMDLCDNQGLKDANEVNDHELGL